MAKGGYSQAKAPFLRLQGSPDLRVWEPIPFDTLVDVMTEDLRFSGFHRVVEEEARCLRDYRKGHRVSKDDRARSQQFYCEDFTQVFMDCVLNVNTLREWAKGSTSLFKEVVEMRLPTLGPGDVMHYRRRADVWAWVTCCVDSDRRCQTLADWVRGLE